MGVSTPVRRPGVYEVPERGPDLIPPRELFDKVIEDATSTDDIDYSGWFCIATNPFPCPAEGCDFVAQHQTAAHLIVVWPTSDDMKLLGIARDCRDTGRNPKIVEYERSMGPCISWDRWQQLGRPVHGMNPDPTGLGDRPGLWPSG